MRLISELDAADARATSLAQELSREQLNWKPHPAKWSIGQCLDHLRVANETYCRAMANALEDQPPSIVEEITPGWFGRWFIRKFIEPSHKTTRGRAPKKTKPAPEVDSSVLDRYLASNKNARELIDRAGNYDVNHIRFTNPYIPVIRFTLGTGFEVLSAHQRRHLLQAERVKSTAGFPEL
jgi:hypothetical protein